MNGDELIKCACGNRFANPTDKRHHFNHFSEPGVEYEKIEDADRAHVKFFNEAKQRGRV